MAKTTGRKSNYHSKVEPRLASVLAWRRHGVTNEQIAKNLGVAYSAFRTYSPLFPALAAALNTGAEQAAAEVENAVFRTAVGYEYVETKTIVEGTTDVKALDVSDAEAAKQIAAGRRRVERTVKQMAPNTTAQIFFLTNRVSKHWRHMKSMELSGPNGEALTPGLVTFYLPEKKPITTPKAANAT